MRTICAILLAATALALLGCDQSGGYVEPAPPTTLWSYPRTVDPNHNIEAIDFLGPLWAPGAENAQLPRLRSLSTCTASDITEPLASCIESVTLDGSPALADDLKPGQIVEIHGWGVSTILGVAPAPGAPPLVRRPNVTIDIRRAIVGPITEIDLDHARLTVLGQRVYLSAATPITSGVGDSVTVYGHITADGEVLAELIEPYEGNPLFLVRGVLTEPSPGRLAIGALEVDISSADRENFPASAPLPGDSVLVLANAPLDAGILTAQTIRCLGECAATHWFGGRVRGFLTAWRSPTDFDIDGTSIRVNTCECVYGPPLALGRFVDMDLNESHADLLPADSTTHRFGLVGRIEAINADYREIVVLGYRIDLSPATQTGYYDVGLYDPLTLSDLSIGEAIEVSGETLGNVVVAGSILGAAPTDGFVRSYDYTLHDPTIEIAGQSILTDGATVVEICDSGDSIGLDTFFATDWSSQGAALLITPAPNVTPLLAQAVRVCIPGAG